MCVLNTVADRVIVISLPGSIRRERVSRHFSAIGITNWEFFDAIDGGQLDLDALEAEGQISRQRDWHYPMRAGEFGCALSHYKVWELIRERGYTSAVICEDDFEFTEDGLQRLQENQAKIPDDWSVVHLHTTLREITTEEHPRQHIAGDIYTGEREWGGAACYWLRRSAADYLYNCVLPLRWATDGLVAWLTTHTRKQLPGRGYVVLPPIGEMIKLPSEIHRVNTYTHLTTLPSPSLPKLPPRRVICVCAVGPYSSLMRVAQESVREYAAAIGVDCFWHTELATKFTVNISKFETAAIAASLGYDEICQLDADIIIRRGSPNIFDAIAASDVDFAAMFGRQAALYMQRVVIPSVDVLLPEGYDLSRFCNSGVLVYRREAFLRVHAKIKEFWAANAQQRAAGLLRCGDEPYFFAAQQSLNLRAAELPYDWNYAWTARSLHDAIPQVRQKPQAFAYHVSGEPSRKFQPLCAVLKELGQVDQLPAEDTLANIFRELILADAEVETVRTSQPSPPFAVCTAAYGDHAKLLDITLPPMTAYAKQCDADMLVQRGQWNGYSFMGKYGAVFAAINAGYKQIAFIDPDVFVMAGAINLFAWAARNTTTWWARPDTVDWFWANEYPVITTQINKAFTGQHYSNTGVVIATAEVWEKLLFEACKQYLRHPVSFNDQWYVNLAAEHLQLLPQALPWVCNQWLPLDEEQRAAVIAADHPQIWHALGRTFERKLSHLQHARELLQAD